MINEFRSDAQVVAKLERPEALGRLDEILNATAAVMVARGDLGVELPMEEIPLLQKDLLRAARAASRPAIVATQMLESMIRAPRPTRAEATDVANAVLDGADGIMLSGETAIGAHPVLAAQAAIRIARLCEDRGAELLAVGAAPHPDSDASALAYAAAAVAATEHDVAAIACYTRTGRTARMIAALRPRVPVLASPPPKLSRRLARMTLSHAAHSPCWHVAGWGQ